MRPVNPLPGGTGSDALGISDLGEICGNSGLGNAALPRAVLWSPAGVALDLGVLPGGTWSSAFGINVFSTVVGNGNCTGSGSHGTFGVRGAAGATRIEARVGEGAGRNVRDRTCRKAVSELACRDISMQNLHGGAPAVFLLFQ